MPTTQRVLSGSLTKGSRATLTGSVKFFYQGINSKDMSVYYGSLVPRVGSGDRMQLYKHGKPVSDVTFDDSVFLNRTADDMGGESDIRLEQRVGFDFESRNFGQPPTTLQGEPYADALDFDPVVYLTDDSEVMWPVNLWNIGDLPKYEYDGVIEPLDIRREILGEIDTRVEGHAIRGSLIGGSSERPWGSLEIKRTWRVNDKQPNPFLDAPDSMGIDGKPIFAMQAFQDITQNQDLGFISDDYHSRIYTKLAFHNESDMNNALRMLNSSSCESITDPTVRSSNSGFYFARNAGSITFGDILIDGEHE